MGLHFEKHKNIDINIYESYYEPARPIECGLFKDVKVFAGNYVFSTDYYTKQCGSLDAELDNVKSMVDKRKYEVFVLYKYEHSGYSLHMSEPSCSFDGGVVGFIAIPKAQARKEYKKCDENYSHIEMMFKDYCEKWNNYFSCNCTDYYYKIPSMNIESDCCYESYDDCLADAEKKIDDNIKIA